MILYRLEDILSGGSHPEALNYRVLSGGLGGHTQLLPTG